MPSQPASPNQRRLMKYRQLLWAIYTHPHTHRETHTHNTCMRDMHAYSELAHRDENKYKHSHVCCNGTHIYGMMIWNDIHIHGQTQTYLLQLWALDLTNAVCAHLSSGMCVEDMSFVFVQRGFVNKSSITAAVCCCVNGEQLQSSRQWCTGCVHSSRNRILKPININPSERSSICASILLSI